MRRKPKQHITEIELLLLSDGELSRRRTLAIHAHLAGCAVCRTLRMDTESRLAELTRSFAVEKNVELPPLDMARHRLSVKLAQLAESSHFATWIHPARWFYSTRTMAYLSAGLAVILGYLLIGYLGVPPLHAARIPNTRLTPGATRRVSKDDICRVGADEMQTVPSTLALRVFQEYGIPNPPPRSYEVDYLISPALGGSADIRNLWPQPYADGAWNSHVKDALEDRLRSLVCEGALDLAIAQRDISTDWIAAYKKYFRTNAPLEIHAGFALDPPWE